MNISDTDSEPTCKRQEDGDVPTVAERPLKKARFAWQVKGKYHLKNEFPDADRSNTVSTLEPTAASSSCTQKNECNDLGYTEKNLEILGDYLLKQDFNTLDSVITDTDSSVLKLNSNVQTETLQYPKYICSYENKNNTTKIKTTSNKNDHAPISLVVSHNFNEDQCIARWQAIQMAKGFVDNTINRVLESWMVTPVQAESDNNRILALDVVDFINNLPGQNSIENEGILMAISAHGLQNTCSSSDSNNFSTEHISNNLSCKDDTFLSPPTSPLNSDEETMHQLNNIDKYNSIEDSCNDDSGISNSDVNQNVTQSLTLSPKSSSPIQQYSSQDELTETSNLDYSKNDSVNDCDVFTTHYDFLDAAVSFAIQSKGLTSLGSDYG